MHLMNSLFKSLGGMIEEMSVMDKAPHRIGPGSRNIIALHRQMRANEGRQTPGAERMRAVVANRARQWE
jgi:hypothetical protein